MQAIDEQLADPENWSKLDLNQQLGQARSRLSDKIDDFRTLEEIFRDISELYALTEEEDQASLDSMTELVREGLAKAEKLSQLCLFTGKFDHCNAFMSIQSGSGGLEAQDWAQMLMRMYLRWSERSDVRCEVVEYTPDEAAGINSCTLFFEGVRVYGLLKNESGVHRLVRKSPFDSGNRRHTSFASVFVEPEIDQNIEVNINPADLRTDVYRASGAGGQHVNKTESAVRITHMPTNTVVQCQSSRSQHKNRETAMKQLKAKLYMLEEEKKREQIAKQQKEKPAITWGNQIRSYVLDQSRIKDLRSGLTIGDTQSVLDGKIDDFLIAGLHHMAKPSAQESV